MSRRKSPLSYFYPEIDRNKEENDRNISPLMRMRLSSPECTAESFSSKYPDSPEDERDDGYVSRNSRPRVRSRSRNRSRSRSKSRYRQRVWEQHSSEKEKSEDEEVIFLDDEPKRRSRPPTAPRGSWRGGRNQPNVFVRDSLYFKHQAQRRAENWGKQRTLRQYKAKWNNYVDNLTYRDQNGVDDMVTIKLPQKMLGTKCVVQTQPNASDRSVVVNVETDPTENDSTSSREERRQTQTGNMQMLSMMFSMIQACMNHINQQEQTHRQVVDIYKTTMMGKIDSLSKQLAACQDKLEAQEKEMKSRKENISAAAQMGQPSPVYQEQIHQQIAFLPGQNATESQQVQMPQPQIYQNYMAAYTAMYNMQQMIYSRVAGNSHAASPAQPNLFAGTGHNPAAPQYLEPVPSGAGPSSTSHKQQQREKRHLDYRKPRMPDRETKEYALPVDEGSDTVLDQEFFNKLEEMMSNLNTLTMDKPDQTPSTSEKSDS